MDDARIRGCPPDHRVAAREGHEARAVLPSGAAEGTRSGDLARTRLGPPRRADRCAGAPGAGGGGTRGASWCRPARARSGAPAREHPLGARGDGERSRPRARAGLARRRLRERRLRRRPPRARVDRRRGAVPASRGGRPAARARGRDAALDRGGAGAAAHGRARRGQGQRQDRADRPLPRHGGRPADRGRDVLLVLPRAGHRNRRLARGGGGRGAGAAARSRRPTRRTAGCGCPWTS